MIRFALPLMAIATVACAQKAPPVPATPVASACGAEQFKHYVGRVRTREVAAAIERDAKGRTMRWISPGTVVTMDYREDRLNVYLAENRVIQRFRCG